KCRIISPSDAFLPPTRATSAMPNDSNHTTHSSFMFAPRNRRNLRIVTRNRASPPRLCGLRGRDPSRDFIYHQLPAPVCEYPMERDVFFVSDRTGITAETLGLSLLAQFNGIRFKKHEHRFVDTLEKARAVGEEIRAAAAHSEARPIVFAPMIDETMRAAVAAGEGIFFDLVDTFITPLEAALGQKSSHTIGRARGMVDQSKYSVRMDAVNYALLTDDGLHTQDYGRADVIVIGVSRSGKTPTCLYLALTFGVYAANYPLTEEIGRAH